MYIPVADASCSGILTPIIRSVDDGLVRTNTSCTIPQAS